MINPETLLGIVAGIAAVVWQIILVNECQNRPNLRAHLLDVAVWAATLFGCAISIVQRNQIGSSGALIALGTGTIFFAALPVILTSRREPSARTVPALAVALFLLEGYYLWANGGSSTARTLSLVNISLLPLFCLTIWSAKPSREHLLRLTERTAKFVLAGSLILAAISPALAFGQASSDQRRILLGPVVERLSGLTPHPNYLGVTAALLALVVEYRRGARWRFWLVIAISVIALTESRTAAFTLALAFSIQWIFKNRPLVRATLAIPALAFAYLLTDPLATDAADSSLTADIDNNGRLRVWKIVWETFSQDPLGGFGPLAFNIEGDNALSNAGLLHAHNQVLQAIAEAGLLGGLLTIALLVSFARAAWVNPNDRLYTGLAVIVIGNCITEPFLSMHLYGLNYAVVLPVLFLLTLFSADAPSPDPTPADRNSPPDPTAKMVGERLSETPPDDRASHTPI